MLKHAARVKNPLRMKLLRKATHRYRTDGLNTVQYRVVRVANHAMYTHMYIDVGQPDAEVLTAIREEELRIRNSTTAVRKTIPSKKKPVLIKKSVFKIKKSYNTSRVL
jgi:hypothetical protein